MSLSINIGRPFLNDKTLDEQARSILRLYGTDAHVYLPGANGVAVSGLLSNNYTLSDGSTGYSAVDGTAGLVLDAAGSVGAELFTGAFTRNNTVESDTTTVPALCTSTGVFSVVGINKTATANTPYQCTLTWSGNTTGRTIQFGGGSGVVVLGTAVSGSATFTVVPSIGNMYIYFAASAAGQAVSFDSFSAKPISGIHATQATTANKAALRRGLYNLLTYSNDLSNAAYVLQGGASKSGQNLLMSAAADGLYHSCTIGVGPITLSYTLSGSGRVYVWGYNATDGTIGLTPIDLTATPTVYVVNITPTVANTTWQIGRTASGTASSVTLGACGEHPGTLTAAQILSEGGIPLTTSAAASNQSAGRYSWNCDGVNDSLALGSVPFLMSDDHCVIAGVRLGANATTRYALNPAVGAGSQRVGAIFINGTNTISAGWTDDVAAANITSPSTYTGQTVVASAVKQSDAKRLRVNGAQAGATNNTVMGTTTLTGGGAIGDWRSGGGNQWSGDIGPVILIKATVSDADLLTLERWVASQTVGGPSF